MALLKRCHVAFCRRPERYGDAMKTGNNLAGKKAEVQVGSGADERTVDVDVDITSQAAIIDSEIGI